MNFYPMTEIITYEALFELLQKEKTRKELQKLDKDFYQKFLKYLEEKILILNSQKSKDSIFSTETKKTEKQVENIKKIVEDIYERRERKIIEAALFSARNSKEGQITSPMLQEEISLFKHLTKSLKDSRENILSNLLQGKLPEIKAKALKSEINKKNNTLIRFLAAVPKFMGPNNEVYGPFEKEDIANLPSEISNILITKKRAIIIEAK